MGGEVQNKPYYMPCSLCGQDGHNRGTCTMPRQALPVVDPQLGDLYRRLENTHATRDMFAQEGLPTDTVDATIEEIRRQIRDVDAKMKAAPASQSGASAAVAPSSSPEQQACWFGFECNRPGCAYHHPGGRRIDRAGTTPSAAGVPSPGPLIDSARAAAADDIDDDEARLRQALELSLRAAATNTKDVLPVPPEWHRFVDQDFMVSIKVATGLLAIDSRMPTRPDLDGHIILQGTPAAVREAKQLLGPRIAKARQEQRKDAPELLALLEMGYERADATRALVETCPRGTVTHRQRVQQALEWLMELHGEEAGDTDTVAESEDQRPIVAVPAPAPRGAPQPGPTPESKPGPGPEPQPQAEPEPERVPVPEPAPAPGPVPAPVVYRIEITGKRRAGLMVSRAATVQRFYEDIGSLCGVPHTELCLTLPSGLELDPTNTAVLGESGVLPGITVTVIDRQPKPAAALAPAPVVALDLDLETGPQAEVEHGVAAGDAPPPPVPPFPGVDGMPDDELVVNKPSTPEPLVVPAPTAESVAVPATTPELPDAFAAASATSVVGSVGVRVNFTSLADDRVVPQSATVDADGIDESTFSTISYVEAGIEPKLSCFNRDDPGYKHVELTQGIIMWTVLTIIDRHGPHLRDIEVQTTDEKNLVCKACQAEHEGLVKRCTDDDMKLLPEDFRFRLGGAGGCPNPYPGTLQAVAAVQHAIENATGSVGFRVTISTDEPEPRCIEQWAVVLQGTASREDLQEPRKTQAIVAMRTLHSFSRLVCRQSSGALQFEISRLHPSEVSSAAKRAVAVTTSFGCVTVDLEYVAEGGVAIDIAAPVDPEPEPEPEVDAAEREKGQQQGRRQEQEGELGFHVANPASWRDIDIPSDDVEDGDIAGPGVMVGRYQVTQYLGKGQFGLVWKATVRDSRRNVDVDVAIKTMDRAKFEGARNKMLVQNEIKSMQAVRHKNVVQLFEPLYSESHVMMVLEFCETDLKKYMYAEGARGLPSRAPLSEAQTKSFMRDLASGLQELRAHDIIHRDLKDENLLITPSALDGRDVLKIADFGFAKQLVDLTATYSQVGSPAYMAPEVLALHNRALRDGTGLGLSGGYNAKADLWSVGCIMYGMLCKRLVFSDDVRTQDDLVNELAREMRDGTQKTLPEFVECEDGRGFDGPASQYNRGAEESPASRECRLILAADAGVANDRVSIIGGHEIAALRPQGQVVVKYRRAVDVSVECRDLLGQLLQHHPQRRIEWPDFFNHPWLQ